MAPFRQRRLFMAGLCAACCVAGCATNGDERNEASLSVFDRVGDAGRSVLETTGRLVKWHDFASMSSIISDPSGPAWEIEEAWFPQQHYFLSLKMRRGYSGGAGEARVVFHRRAKEIMLRSGFDGYQVVEYSEGLQSSFLGSQRVTEGVIQLTQKVPVKVSPSLPVAPAPSPESPAEKALP